MNSAARNLELDTIPPALQRSAGEDTSGMMKSFGKIVGYERFVKERGGPTPSVQRLQSCVPNSGAISYHHAGAVKIESIDRDPVQEWASTNSAWAYSSKEEDFYIDVSGLIDVGAQIDVSNYLSKEQIKRVSQEFVFNMGLLLPVSPIVAIPYTKQEHKKTLKDSSPKKLYPWFDAALKLERRGKRTSAVTAIFISINELMKEKKFSTINDFLKSLDATDYSLSILEGILSITRPISSHLSARNKFLQDVRAEVTSCGEDPDEALRGLEGQPYDESSLQDE